MSASSKDGLFAVCGSFIGLSTIAVSLRFYARKYQRLPLGLDDWTALFGVITYIAAAGLAISIAALGVFGYANLTPAEKEARTKTGDQISFAYDWMNLNTLACAKLSALFMYRRIFAVDRNGTFNRVIWGTVIVVVLWCISSDILSLLQCGSHFAAAWNGNFLKYCNLNPVWAKELAFTDFFLDVWILTLPVYPIMRLHTTTTKKFGIFGVFLLAFIGLGASIARIYYFTRAKAPGQITLYIGVLESGISITVVNFPSLYYLFTSVVPEQVAVSLRSIRSLGSGSSHGSRSRSGNDPQNTAAEQDQLPITDEVAVHGKGSWSSQGSSYAGNGSRTDVEAGHGASYELRNVALKGDEGPRNMPPQNAIHVQSDAKVRREGS